VDLKAWESMELQQGRYCNTLRVFDIKKIVTRKISQPIYVGA
jgi:hypothetical protein